MGGVSLKPFGKRNLTFAVLGRGGRRPLQLPQSPCHQRTVPTGLRYTVVALASGEGELKTSQMGFPRKWTVL